MTTPYSTYPSYPEGMKPELVVFLESLKTQLGVTNETVEAITGSGTDNVLAKFSAGILVDSIVSESGTTITIAGSLGVGNITSTTGLLLVDTYNKLDLDVSGAAAWSAAGSISVGIDSDNNETDREFTVYKNGVTPTTLLTMKENGDLYIARSVYIGESGSGTLVSATTTGNKINLDSSMGGSDHSISMSSTDEVRIYIDTDEDTTTADFGIYHGSGFGTIIFNAKESGQVSVNPQTTVTYAGGLDLDNAAHLGVLGTVDASTASVAGSLLYTEVATGGAGFPYSLYAVTSYTASEAHTTAYGAAFQWEINGTGNVTTVEILNVGGGTGSSTGNVTTMRALKIGNKYELGGTIGTYYGIYVSDLAATDYIIKTLGGIAHFESDAFIIGTDPGGTRLLRVGGEVEVGGDAVSVDAGGAIGDSSSITFTGGRASFGYYGTNSAARVLGGGGKGVEFWADAARKAYITSTGNFIIGTDPGGSGLLRVGGSVSVNGHVFGVASSYPYFQNSNALGLLIQSSGLTTGNTGGGLQLLGGGYLHTPNWGGMWAGATSDMGTYTARDTEAAGIEFRDGKIYFRSNTGLTIGNTFSPAVRMLLDTTGDLILGTDPTGSALLRVGGDTYMKYTVSDASSYPGTLYCDIVLDTASTGGPIAAGFYALTSHATGTVNEIYGADHGAIHGGAGTLAWGTAIECFVGIETGAGNWTEAAGIYVAPAFDNSASGAFGTLIGIDIDDVTLGGTNYALRTGRGLVEMGDDVLVTRSNDAALSLTLRSDGDTSGNGVALHIYDYAGTNSPFPYIDLFGAGGTQASPAAIDSGDWLGSISFGGYSGAGYPWGAYIYGSATENWSGSQQGAKLVFVISEAGTTTARETLLLDSNRDVVLGAGNELGTTSTQGFFYVPTVNGTPTGTPTSRTGAAAMKYDRSNNHLMVYNGAWETFHSSLQGYDEMTTPVGTTSATLEDVTGASITVTLPTAKDVLVYATVEIETQSGASPTTIGLAINGDGTDGTEVQRYLSGTSDKGLGSVMARFTGVAAGSRTFKLRFRRVTGSATPGINVAQMYLQAV